MLQQSPLGSVFSGNGTRSVTDLESLNEQAAHWCSDIACRRRCPQDPDIIIAEAFERERNALRWPQDNPFECDDAQVVSIGKTPYAHTKTLCDNIRVMT